MNHSLVAFNVYQFLSNVYQNCHDREQFNSFLVSLKSPRFAPVSAIYSRWEHLFASHMPQLLDSFEHLLACAENLAANDDTLRRVADHFMLIYRVSCFLNSDLELELFVRCLCLDRSTPVQHKEVKETIFQFLNQLPVDSRDDVMYIITEDEHEYLDKQDCVQNGFLDLDRLHRIISDNDLFEQVMATIQINTLLSLPWTQTIQDIYEAVCHKDIWDQLAPVLQQVQAQRDSSEYTSYEDYVQKNFLDDGGQEYLDNEINHFQVEHMFQNLKM